MYINYVTMQMKNTEQSTALLEYNEKMPSRSDKKWPGHEQFRPRNDGPWVF